MIHSGFWQASKSTDAFQLVASWNRAATTSLLEAVDCGDVIIPRGLKF